MLGLSTPYAIVLLEFVGFCLLWWGFMRLPLPPLLKTGVIVCVGILLVVLTINHLSAGDVHADKLIHS
jgi:uncharacterized membrane protein YwzB